MIICSIDNYKILIAFVTGNANKLKEVKAILSQGGNPIEIDSQSLDSELNVLGLLHNCDSNNKISVPEVQGTTQEVAIAKCKTAADLVCLTFMFFRSKD
jgi:inosine triphosphate pyrophosphatase